MRASVFSHAATRICVPALLVAVLVWPLPTRAGTIVIEAGSAPDELSLRVDDEPLDEVLRHLGQRYGFAIASAQAPRSAERISGQFSGSLDAVLRRLLRNRDHMITRAGSARSSVSRVIMLEASARAPALPSARHAGPASTPVRAAPPVKNTREENLLTWRAMADRAKARQ